MNISFSTRSSGLLLAASLMIVLTGCGKSSGNQFETYHISGKVIYDGQPLPFGTIVFEPDPSKGSAGPQGTASIKDGVYDTSKGGTGSVGGPMIVTISGMTHEAVVEGGEGRFLFQDYKTTKDLPRETTTADFDIPKDRKKWK